mmetsp:Transcript_33677/g.105857  ORF Transcript_33677/g.105857 Transcript_33677/m.105857 type:complete len:238 (-) Transcript_33677:86-799(-)
MASPEPSTTGVSRSEKSPKSPHEKTPRTPESDPARSFFPPLSGARQSSSSSSSSERASSRPFRRSYTERWPSDEQLASCRRGSSKWRSCTTSECSSKRITAPLCRTSHTRTAPSSSPVPTPCGPNGVQTLTAEACAARSFHTGRFVSRSRRCTLRSEPALKRAPPSGLNLTDRQASACGFAPSRRSAAAPSSAQLYTRICPVMRPAASSRSVGWKSRPKANARWGKATSAVMAQIAA